MISRGGEDQKCEASFLGSKRAPGETVFESGRQKRRFGIMFVWSEKYSVNVDEIDRQHKKLIGLVNTLDQAMREGKGKSVLSDVLKELVQYTQMHFAAEERIMKTNEYPAYAEHKAKHDKMTMKVLEIQKQYQEGKVAITFEVMKFLEDWVDKHILGTDKKYAPHLNSRGVR